MALNPRLALSSGRSFPLLSRRRLLIGLAIVALDVAVVAGIAYFRWSPPPLERPAAVPAVEALVPAVATVIAPGPDIEALPIRLVPIVPETAEAPAKEAREPARERQRDRAQDRDRTAAAPTAPVTVPIATTQPMTNDTTSNDDPIQPPSSSGGDAQVDGTDPAPAGPGGSPGGGGGSGDDGTGPGGV